LALRRLSAQSHLVAAVELSRLGGRELSGDGLIGTRRPEKILCDARNRRREVGIVGTTTDHGLPFDEGLIFAVQVESRFDCDRPANGKTPFGGQCASKIAHFTARIGVQSECHSRNNDDG
jgi:hypothetical protein